MVFKNVFALLFVVIAAGCFSCSQSLNGKEKISEVSGEIDRGNFIEAVRLAGEYREKAGDDLFLVTAMDSLIDRVNRLRIDFSVSGEEIRERLTKAVGSFSEEQIEEWEERGWLEWHPIDGEKRYYNRAATNLKRIIDFHYRKEHPEEEPPVDQFTLFKMEYASGVVSDPGNFGKPVTPVTMKVKFSVTVDSDVVPAGETVRCWLPWLHEQHARQQEVQLTGAFPEEYFIAPDSVKQRSIYMEQRAEEGQPLSFNTEFTYRSFGHYFDPEVLAQTPFANRDEMGEHLKEQAPHILFTPEIEQLSQLIVGDAATPFEIVKRIFYWIDDNIPWAGAVEYGLMSNIPEYVIKYRRGDCGMKTLLLMTLARYNGVPVKWQSGWMMHPGQKNLHDWCEVWYSGIGWVPVDMSFGRLPSENPRISDFYLTGIDPWRMIVNDDVGTPFSPPRRHFRSDPVDFQRGELEWRNGNLYYDKWNYRMILEYPD